MYCVCLLFHYLYICTVYYTETLSLLSFTAGVWDKDCWFHWHTNSLCTACLSGPHWRYVSSCMPVTMWPVCVDPVLLVHCVVRLWHSVNIHSNKKLQLVILTGHKTEEVSCSFKTVDQLHFYIIINCIIIGIGIYSETKQTLHCMYSIHRIVRCVYCPCQSVQSWAWRGEWVSEWVSGSDCMHSISLAPTSSPRPGIDCMSRC